MINLALIIVLCFNGLVCAEKITLIANQDNTLYETTDGNISNGSGSYLFVGATGANGIRRSLIRFNLSHLPDGIVINSAILNMYMDKSKAGASVISVHRVVTDWGEGKSNASGSGGEGLGDISTQKDATWLHSFYPDQLWNQPGGDYTPMASSEITITDEGQYAWSSVGLSEDVKFWLKSPESNFGWILIGDESKTSTAKRFTSRDFIDQELHPHLIIDYTYNQDTAAHKSTWAELKSR